MMLESLLNGMPASKVFRGFLELDATIDAGKLIDFLLEEFPDISPAAVISIRKWCGPEEKLNFPDAQLDALIHHHLDAGGYLR
ncbi:MAG TPA: hypothetical protein VF491_12350 [Vicinamibacterales bacterium]